MQKITISVPTVKPRNLAAMALAERQFAQKTVQSKKAYNRKRDRRIDL